MVMSFNVTFAQSRLFTIHKKDGTTVNYLFRDKPVVTFSGDDLLLTTSEVVVTYPIMEIYKYTINEINTDFNSKDIIINEDILISYENASNIENCNITYIRTFNDTEWQSLYIPFELDILQIQSDFEIAIISNFHQYDDNNDGIFDRTVLEIRRVTNNERLLPNYPYLIKAKTPGLKTIKVYNTTLYSTEQASIDCSSVEIRYTFTGTYNYIEDLRSFGYYYLSDGTLNRPTSSLCSLQPFRWYMMMNSRGSQFKENPIIINSKKIDLKIIGEETNDIIGTKPNDVIPVATYSIDGLRKPITSSKGVYIMHMNDGSSKKILIK